MLFLSRNDVVARLRDVKSYRFVKEVKGSLPGYRSEGYVNLMSGDAIYTTTNGPAGRNTPILAYLQTGGKCYLKSASGGWQQAGSQTCNLGALPRVPDSPSSGDYAREEVRIEPGLRCYINYSRTLIGDNYKACLEHSGAVASVEYTITGELMSDVTTIDQINEPVLPSFPKP